MRVIDADSSRVGELTRLNRDLNTKIAELEQEIEYLRDRLLREDVPSHVKYWMAEYNTGWESFYCFICDQWFDKLDPNYPSSTVYNSCECQH